MLALTFKAAVHVEWISVRSVRQMVSPGTGHLVSSAPFVEKTFFNPSLNGLGTLVQNQSTVNVRAYLGSSLRSADLLIH